MKKILALLMMFLISGNFLFAQVEGTTGTGEATATVSVQPKLNFQAVVRNADNELVFEKEMTVVINITSGGAVAYSETHEGVMTNKNGLLTIIIGGEDATNVNGSLYDVDWSDASIEAALTFTATVVDDENNTSEEETTITVTSEVTAVPYALQAGSTKLNTDMIVRYISGIKLGTEADKYDVLKILDAIRYNEHGLKEALKDTIVEYMKTRMDLAKEVFQYYLSHATVADVQNTYDEVVLNPEAKAAILEVIKQFIKDHEADAIDIAKYYVDHITTAQLQNLYEEFHNNTVLESLTKTFVVHYLEEYLNDHHYVSVNDCPSVEVCALANTGKPCPTSNAFIGATNNVSGTLQTTITNPDALSLTATYNGTYTVDGETVPFSFTGSKDGENLIKASDIIPDGATNVSGTITVHVYGCDTDFTKTF